METATKTSTKPGAGAGTPAIAAPPDTGIAAAAPLATVAAARIGDLLDEVPADPAARARAEGRVLALPRERLSWEARVELARLGDRIARRRGDAELLDELARGAGCAREVFQTGTAGALPHLDLENPLPPPGRLAPVQWRGLLTPGCRVSVPSWNARPGVQVLRTSIGVPRGRYSVVLDFGGEARLRVDGGSFQRHGDDRGYGPRVSRTLVELGAGRHDIELRLAAPAGRSDLSLWILPESSSSPSSSSSSSPLPPGEPGRASAVEYANAFVAERLGESDRALGAGAALGRRRSFAAGLALAATIARGDATRPAGFARDSARTLLRAAVESDPAAARVWHALAELELDAEHPRDAIEHAQRAARAAPRWWLPEVVLATALRSRGLEWDADRALDRAAAAAGPLGGAPCSLVTALLRRAEDRRDLASQPPLVDRLAGCDADAGVVIDRLRARGDLEGAIGLLRRRVTLDPDREDLRTDLAGALLARRDFIGARAELRRMVAEDPSDALLRVRLADAEVAAGDVASARRTLAAALARRPDLGDVRRAARAIGLALPLDEFRIDGRQVIRDFRASGRRYAAPAVMILDRTVHGVFKDGAELILTHNIVSVETKDGIERWGEVTVPAGGEILMLRTHKKDGSTREPEEIAGKEAISAPDLAVGDCVEWETLESKAASDAFAPGFLGERFFFQSFDSPLDRSEYLLITPEALALDVDRRAGAPVPSAVMKRGADGDSLRVTTFAAHEVPQLFAERSAVPAIEYVPSVRVSSRVSWQGWARFLDEQLYGTWRSSPAIRELAATLAMAARGAPAATQAATIVRWVTDNVEAGDDLRDPATFTLARGRGNRLALVLALARELGVAAVPELVRSRLVADADGVLAPQEVDDFGDTVVRFDVGGRPVYVDLRLRHASFGYLPPSLDGAKTLSLDGGSFGVARGGGAPDQRTVDMTIRLDERGGGEAHATEELTGWPALEWAELMDRFGSDKVKLRQDFEQRWLGVQFPGARLDDLQVDVAPPSGAAPAAATGSPRPSEGRVRVRYSFVSPQLGVRSDQEIKLSPTFFRSQPGRRFAAEARRSTTLMLGFDVPVRLTATVVLPAAARVVDPATPPPGVIARQGAYRFIEERTSRPGSPEVLLLHRESALPLTRVPPAEYAGVAADLRRVDGLEQQEIRIRLHGAIIGRGAGAR
jgi:tetratricopeptide (TPR) repeat protein